ncbi:MAG: hypothetical protein B7Z16_15640, partial [Algoriphagus sp. 32-45-6]
MYSSSKFFFKAIGVALFVFKSLVADAQKNISFRQLSVNDGLSQNSAVSIAQDPKGFLWVATQEGLNRYDGNQFLVYPKKFNDITQESQVILGKVLADKKGRIWIIPDTNIPEFLESGADTFVAVEGIHSANEIFEDQSGRIWFGTLSGQLFLWNEDLQAAENVWINPSKEVVDIGEFADELLVTFKDEIAIFDKTNFQPRTLIKRKSPSPFSKALFTNEKQLLIGTLKDGLWIADSDGSELKPISEFLKQPELSLDDAMVLDLYQDSKGMIWVATYGNGSFMIDLETRQIQHFTYSKQNPRSLH